VNAPAGLTVRDVGSSGRHRLLLSGELDIASAPMLEATLASVTAKGASEVVLDLTELTFMDSTGLRAVLSLHELCSQEGYAFSLTGANGSVQRLFELTGVVGSLRPEPR